MTRTLPVLLVASLVVAGRFAPVAVAQVPYSPELPEEARGVLSSFAAESYQLHERLQQSHAALQAARERAIERLQAVQDNYTRAANLDAALAIREQIRGLQRMNNGATGTFTLSARTLPANGMNGVTIYSSPPIGTLVLSNPATYTGRTAIATAPENLGNLYQRVGETFTFVVRGRTDGYVWGDRLYTYDSSLATAAVHSGAVRDGEEAAIRVTIVPGPAQFAGGSRNGVTSHVWNNSDGHYTAYFIERIEKTATANVVQSSPYRAGNVPPTVELETDPGTLSSYVQLVGHSFRIRLTGSNEGWVWGTGTYTHDSQLAAAAVHAGMLNVGQTGTVTVVLGNGPAKFTGSAAHGITSHDWDNGGGAYKGYQFVSVERTPTTSYRRSATSVARPNVGGWIPGFIAADEIVLNDAPHTMAGHREQVGTTFIVPVRAANLGTVWGSAVYTHDSSLATAAVHAGLLRPNESGYLRVVMVSGPKRFAGSNCHDVQSHDWDNSGGYYAGFVLSLISKDEGPAPTDRSDAAPPAAPRTVVVPLASRDLLADHVVQQSDLVLLEMTKAGMDARNFDLTKTMIAPEQIIGRAVIGGIKSGEPFLTTNLHLDRSRGR